MIKVHPKIKPAKDSGATTPRNPRIVPDIDFNNR